MSQEIPASDQRTTPKRAFRPVRGVAVGLVQTKLVELWGRCALRIEGDWR